MKKGSLSLLNFGINWPMGLLYGPLINKHPAAPLSADLTAMLANPAVAYSANASTTLSQIYKQNWISLFHQPMEAWTLVRRTNYATPNVALSTTSPGYNLYKMIYPQSEIDGNFTNWSTATCGTDAPTKKTWFIE